MNVVKSDGYSSAEIAKAEWDCPGYIILYLLPFPVFHFCSLLWWDYNTNSNFLSRALKSEARFFSGFSWRDSWMLCHYHHQDHLISYLLLRASMHSYLRHKQRSKCLRSICMISCACAAAWRK